MPEISTQTCSAAPPAASARTARRTRSGLNVGYALLTVAYVGGLTWLSSIPRQTPHEPHPLVELSLNFMHIPLFAGLAFCLVRSLNNGGGWRTMSAPSRILVLLSLAAFSAFNEWQQKFVPGRFCSAGDFTLDVLGIATTLFVFQIERFLADKR